MHILVTKEETQRQEGLITQDNRTKIIKRDPVIPHISLAMPSPPKKKSRSENHAVAVPGWLLMPMTRRLLHTTSRYTYVHLRIQTTKILIAVATCVLRRYTVSCVVGSRYSIQGASSKS